MYAQQCHLGLHRSNCSASPCELHGYREPMERQLGRISEETGLHAEPHLLSASVLSASGSHHPLLSLLVFRSTVSPPTTHLSPPPRLPPSQSFSHLLPLL